MENILQYLPLLIQYGPTVKGILDLANSNEDAATRLQKGVSAIAPILEQLGAKLFPKAASAIHVVGGAIAAYDPNIVKWVQGACNAEVGSALVVDGVYGPHTRDAVAKLQEKLGLKVDGLAGQVTQAAIGMLLAKAAK